MATIFPIERRFARARSDPHWQAASFEPLDYPASNLSRAAENQGLQRVHHALIRFNPNRSGIVTSMMGPKIWMNND